MKDGMNSVDLRYRNLITPFLKTYYGKTSILFIIYWFVYF